MPKEMSDNSVIIFYLSMEHIDNGILCKTAKRQAAIKIPFCESVSLFSEIFKGLNSMSGLPLPPCISSLIELLQSFITSNYLTWPK